MVQFKDPVCYLMVEGLRYLLPQERSLNRNLLITAFDTEFIEIKSVKDH